MKLVRNYIFWAYERGSFHYDVMVTLILIFVFVTPRFVDFGDKPVPVAPHASDVLIKQAVTNAGHTRILYEIRAENLAGATADPALRAAILSVIQPVSGNVTLEQYHPVTDAKGKVIAYDATVLR